MSHERKRTARLIDWSLAGLIVLTPVCLWLLAWLAFRPYEIKKQREVENVVQKFREGYGADRLDKICEAVYGCSLSSSAKEDWHSYVQKVRELAGSFKSVKYSKIEVREQQRKTRRTRDRHAIGALLCCGYVLKATTHHAERGV